MAASETAADDRSSPEEPETVSDEEQEEEEAAPASPAKAKGKGRPKKEKPPKTPKTPKTPKEKVPRGRGRPKGKGKPATSDTPPFHDMVVEALESLDERKGVTLHAIKRFMEENYKVDMEKQAIRVRKAILAGVESGDIIRTHGVGALGRFKLKPFKAAAVHKRAAPEDYVQLPYGKSASPKSPGKVGKYKKAISEEKAKDAVSSPAKGQRGRPKRK